MEYSVAQTELEERICLALGKYVVAFSSLMFSLETGTIKFMGIPQEKVLMASAAFAERTANPVVAAFFSVLHLKWAAS
jgi:hypothetical protein